jgi:hypothetical protein
MPTLANASSETAIAGTAKISVPALDGKPDFKFDIRVVRRLDYADDFAKGGQALAGFRSRQHQCAGGRLERAGGDRLHGHNRGVREFEIGERVADSDDSEVDGDKPVSRD